MYINNFIVLLDSKKDDTTLTIITLVNLSIVSIQSSILSSLENVASKSFIDQPSNSILGTENKTSGLNSQEHITLT